MLFSIQNVLFSYKIGWKTIHTEHLHLQWRLWFADPICHPSQRCRRNCVVTEQGQTLSVNWAHYWFDAMRLSDPVQFPKVWHQGKNHNQYLSQQNTKNNKFLVFAKNCFHKAIHLKTNQYNNNVSSLLLKIWPPIKGIVVRYSKMKTSLLPLQPIKECRLI